MKKLTVLKKSGELHATIEIDDVSVDEFIIQVESGSIWGTLDEEGNQVEQFTVSRIEDITEEYNMRVNVAHYVAVGEPDDYTCKRCINLIRGYNKERNLTTAQILEMISTFSSIDATLKNGMAQAAKGLISQVAVDGVIVTDDLKTMLLYILKEY